MVKHKDHFIVVKSGGESYWVLGIRYWVFDIYGMELQGAAASAELNIEK